MAWYWFVIIGIGIIGLSELYYWIHGPTPFPPTGTTDDLRKKLAEANDRIRDLEFCENCCEENKNNINRIADLERQVKELTGGK